MRIEDLIGRSLGRYEITKLLGRGGMAAVFEANDTVLRRPVALKVLYSQYLADEALVQRFRREAIVAARLEHPNIVPIYDVGETEGSVYIAMKLLSGRSLQDVLLEQTSALPLERSLNIISQLAAALDYAHQHGVIHRDIKPGNVMLTANDHVVLTDFGIAKALDAPGMTGTGVIIGTPDYMAPEQIDAKQGPLDQRADIYALGVLTYRMLTGQRPFDGSTTEVLMAHLSQQPPLASQHNPSLPPSIDQVVSRALAKAPANRPASAGAFAADLRNAVGTATAVGALTPPPGALRRGAEQAVIPAAATSRLVDRSTKPLTPEEARRMHTQAQQRRQRSGWPILLSIGVIMLLIAGAVFWRIIKFRSDTSTEQTSQAQVLLDINATSTAIAAAFAPSAVASAAPAATATLLNSPTPSPTPQATSTASSESAGQLPTSAATLVSAPPPDVRPSATPQPAVPTNTAPPAPTNTPPPPSPTPCAGPLQGGFGALWRSQPTIAASLGCPTSGEGAAEASVQYFEGGIMYYWQPTGSIYVFYGASSGSWTRYSDPGGADVPQETAPDGLYEPVRGFGSIWRNIPSVRDALGWATTPEYPITGVAQVFPNGLMLFSPAVTTAPARIWVLTNAGTWNLYRDPNS